MSNEDTTTSARIDKCREETVRALTIAWDRLVELLPRRSSRVGRTLCGVGLFDSGGQPIAYPDGSNPMWIPTIGAALKSLDVADVSTNPKWLEGVSDNGMPLKPLALACPFEIGGEKVWGVSLAAVPEGSLNGETPTLSVEASVDALKGSLSSILTEFGEAVALSSIEAIRDDADTEVQQALAQLIPGTARARGLILGAELAGVGEVSIRWDGNLLTVNTRFTTDSEMVVPAVGIESFVLASVERSLRLTPDARAGLLERMHFETGIGGEGSVPAAEASYLDVDPLCSGLLAATLSSSALARMSTTVAPLGAGGVLAFPDQTGNVLMDGMLVGGGASTGNDGKDVIGTPELGYVDIGDLETWETAVSEGGFGGRIVTYGAAGAGRYRGGGGLATAVDRKITISGKDPREIRLVVPGLHGGRAGMPAAIVGPEDLPAELGAFTALQSDSGQSSLVVVSAGGPGHGDPLDRSPALVQHDVRTGRLSVEQARALYGVVLSERLLIDEAETEAVRAAVRASRVQNSQPHYGKGD